MEGAGGPRGSSQAKGPAIGKPGSAKMAVAHHMRNSALVTSLRYDPNSLQQAKGKATREKIIISRHKADTVYVECET